MPMDEVRDSRFVASIRCVSEFVEKEEQLDRLVHLTIRGLSYVERQPALLRVLYEEDPAKAADLESADAAATIATSESDNDYPLLHAQAVISLWSALEASIRSLFATLMKEHDPARDIPALRKVKVHLATYEALEELERYLYVLDLLEEAMGTRRKPGANRFDELFVEFGMPGATQPAVVQCLLELYHVRNVLVHRHGRADRRFLKDCPWVGLTEGTELLISHRLYHHYTAGVDAYMSDLSNRVRRYFGLEPFEHKPDCTPEMRQFVHEAKWLAERSKSGRTSNAPH